MRLARGYYVIPIDLDICIDADKLAKIILKYLELNLRPKCLILANPDVHLVGPRELLLKIGGYKDLNYGEDIELLKRIFHNNVTISLPIKVASDFRGRVNATYNNFAFLYSYFNYTIKLEIYSHLSL